MVMKKKSNKWSIQLSKQHRDILKSHCKENGLNMSGYIEKLIEKNIPIKKNLNENEFYQSFEPKVSNRHIVYVKNKKGETLIPPFVIKYSDRPDIVYLDNNSNKEQTFIMKCYDPISPSILHIIESIIKNRDLLDITLVLLGPVGDKIEEWEIKDARICKAELSSVNWEGNNEPTEIILFLIASNIELK